VTARRARKPPPSPIGEIDLHLFNEGSHLELWRKMGAQRIHEGADGTHFAVWAPNARYVSVIGDFNGWEKGSHPMTVRGNSGIWEIFVPGVRKGVHYKYHVASASHGYAADKADPFAFHAETPPGTASIVWDLDYAWGDAEWMDRRADRNARGAPISIYGCTWDPGGAFRRSPTAL
jgi:1,4-alpha-glucan branching enzyme